MPVPRCRREQHRGRQEDRVAPARQAIRNDAGMRIVAPAMLAIAVSVKSSAWVNGNPRLSIAR